MKVKRVLKWIFLGFLALFLLLAGITFLVFWFDLGVFYRTRLTKTNSGIVRHPPVTWFMNRGTLDTLPSYDPNSTDSWQVDLRSRDITKVDLHNRLADLHYADFDHQTQWPATLPASFNPDQIMELGKNPGLGVRRLHQKGITGKDIGIAIIDQCLLVDHIEYKDRLKLYEEIHLMDTKATMHGPAVASIAVGKTVGVAPEADLYFIGETHTMPKLLITKGWGPQIMHNL